MCAGDNLIASNTHMKETNFPSATTNERPENKITAWFKAPNYIFSYLWLEIFFYEALGNKLLPCTYVKLTL